MRPPLFFDSVKEPLQRGFSCPCGAIHLQSPPRPVEKKTFGRKTALCALFAYDTGGPARDLGRSNRCQRWARALVLAISISLASGLRRKLAHSDARPLPTKTASLGFRGGPDLLKLSALRPRRSASVRRRVQDRFDLRFPSAAALPALNRPSHYLPASRSEAERAGPEGQAFHRPPRKPHPHPQMRRSTLSVPRDPRAPQYQPSSFYQTDHIAPRFAQT